MQYQPRMYDKDVYARLIPVEDRPLRHWPRYGIAYLLRHDDDGSYVHLWQHDLPQYSAASFTRLCDAMRWRCLSIRAWDEELMPEEEAFVVQGRAVLD